MLVIVGIAFIIVTFIVFVISAANETSEYVKRFKWFLIVHLTIFSLLGFINALLPSTNRAAIAVVGAKAIDSNTTSILSNLPEKYAKMLDSKADAYLKETLNDAK